MCCCLSYAKALNDEYGELRREGFVGAVEFHPFVTRLEQRLARRIALGDLEESLSDAERRDGRAGVADRRMSLPKQIRIFFRELFDGLRGHACHWCLWCC